MKHKDDSRGPRIISYTDRQQNRQTLDNNSTHTHTYSLMNNKQQRRGDKSENGGATAGGKKLNLYANLTASK